jgi:hypothetical protein
MGWSGKIVCFSFVSGCVTGGKVNFSTAKVFDFTGALADGCSYQCFGQPVIEALRQPVANKLAIVLDSGFAFVKKAPHLVLDHLNLSGNSPLIGPNNPIGERFPVINGIYVTEFPLPLSPAMERGVAVGLKAGLKPSPEELERIYFLGGHFCCYNLVPTMLIAAHAGWRLLAVVGPEGNSWQKEVMQGLQKLE